MVWLKFCGTFYQISLFNPMPKLHPAIILDMMNKGLTLTDPHCTLGEDGLLINLNPTIITIPFESIVETKPIEINLVEEIIELKTEEIEISNENINVEKIESKELEQLQETQIETKEESVEEKSVKKPKKQKK